jgi:subtilase family serine protease
MALLLCPWLSAAQTPQPRLRGPLTGRTTLANSRSPRLAEAQDLGAVSPDTQLPGITLVFKRSPEQESTLQQLLAAQQNTASPLYHQWLTPETFAARFGVADDDIATTEAWLQSLGFHIDSVSRSRDRITFSGNAAQVQAAFGTELHHYKAEGETHLAPASNLTLPTELASITTAVIHLSDFRPKPNVIRQTHPQPDYTSFKTQAHYLGPFDVAAMYDLGSVKTGGDGNGSGQSLAVVGQSYVNTVPPSSVSTFQTYMTRAGNITPVLVPGSGVQAVSPGDESESEIDIEYSSGIAYGANVFLVYVGANQTYDVFDSLAYAITSDIAPVISISYGACESVLSPADLDENNAVFEEAATQGQTIVASAGDSGSTACADYTTSDGVTVAQQQALAVNFPASSPYVTAVGGTQLAAGTFSAGASTYWATAVNSVDSSLSLLSYVPEVAWNEDSTSNGIAAGGGGMSTHFLRPTWQTGVPGIPAGTYRLLPDISLQASIASPGYLVCLTLSDSTSTCVNGMRDSNNDLTTAGGTSFAAPIFAGFLANLNEAKQGTGQGNVNPLLYGLAANPATYAAAFHDITSGTIACSGVSTCSAASQSGYGTTSGYDMATGLGSLDFGALSTAWPSNTYTSLIPTVTSVTPASLTPVSGATDPIQIIVSSFAAITPATGTLRVALDGSPLDSSLPIPTPGQAITYSLVTPPTAGSHIITVSYSGDATHSPSTASTAVLVGDVLATGSISIAASNLTVATGSTATSQVTITPAAGYTGRVSWSLAFASNSAGVQACYLIDSPSVTTTTSTNLTIGIGTACNSPLPSDYRALKPAAPPALAKNTTTPDNPSKAIYATLLLCGLLATRRRKLTPSLLLALLSLAAIGSGLTGCGSEGGTSSGTPTPSVTATTYTMTLTGKDSVNSAITASTTFTLTVNE